MHLAGVAELLTPQHRRFGKAHRATHETLDWCPQIDEFALDGLSSVSGNYCTATRRIDGCAESVVPTTWCHLRLPG
jgi:hypothetical protein